MIWIIFDEEANSHTVATHTIPGGIEYDITMEDLKLIKELAKTAIEEGKPIEVPADVNEDFRGIILDLNEQIMDTAED